MLIDDIFETILPLSIVARMPELRAGADTRRLGIVLKFLSLRATGKQFHNISQQTPAQDEAFCCEFDGHSPTPQKFSRWVIQQMCKECSSLGTIVNCEVNLTVYGER